jgi:hypothetical protein
MCLVNKHFHNYDVSQIIYLTLKVKYINFGYIVSSGSKSNFNITQNFLLSPFLCNILLHELDVFVANLCKIFSKNKKIVFSENPIILKRNFNTPWKSIRQNIKSKIGNTPRNVINKALRQVHLQAAVLKKVKAYTKNGNWQRLTYVRYIDDFLLGFIGPKTMAISTLVRQEVFSCNTGMLMR